MARTREILLPWTSQPQEAVGLNLSHPCAGMVRGYSDVINSSTQPVIVGTRVIVQKTGLMRGYYSTLGAGTTDKLDTGITGTNPAGVSYLLIGSQLSVAGGYGRIFTQNDQHFWTATASQNLSFYLSSGSPYWTIPQLTSVPTVNVITYAGDTSDPKMWRDGVAQTVVYESGTRSGVIRNISQSIFLGNRAAGDRGHDGSIGLFIPFDGVLSDSDAASLSADPCQLLAPQSIWVPVSAGGGGSTVTLTGTVTTATESDIVAGGKTIILTLTGDTWVASGATFNAIRQNIIDGIDSDLSESGGWDAQVKANQGVSGVVRTSDTVVTITLDAQASYNITATETITATIPASAVSLAAPIVASPAFTVTPVSAAMLFRTRSTYGFRAGSRQAA